MVIAAILLAAGRPPWSDTPAALLPWGDRALIEHQVAQLREGGAGVITVVVGDEAARIIPLLSGDGVEPIAGASAAMGLAGALRVGTAAVPRDADAALIVRVEEPRPAAVHAQLIERHRADGAAATRAAYHGVAGAPAVVRADVLAALRNVAEGDDLGTVLVRAAGTVRDVEFETDVVLLDVSVREAYERARPGA